MEEILKIYKQKVDEYINKHISSMQAPDTIKKACLYSVNSGGKGVRPSLFLLSCSALGMDIDEKQIAFASALEMIHTYSLIHDDLPAMDNDDYRRGNPTNHKVYGEAIAILAGDALLNFAYETMYQNCKDSKDAAAAAYIAKAAGMSGMIGGQVLDIGSLDTEDDILYMYSLKTGALLRASIVSAAIMHGADAALIDKLEKYAKNLGVAFQIADDYIDKTTPQEHSGLPKDSDSRNKKSTFLSKQGQQANAEKLNKYTQDAMNALSGLDEAYDSLRRIAEYLNRRSK